MTLSTYANPIERRMRSTVAIEVERREPVLVIVRFEQLAHFNEDIDNLLFGGEAVQTRGGASNEYLLSSRWQR